jgi:diguanylate cyclase (GGDEF)-like protein
MTEFEQVSDIANYRTDLPMLLLQWFEAGQISEAQYISSVRACLGNEVVHYYTTCTDTLTGVKNRRKFEVDFKNIEDALKEAQMGHASYIAVDIDHFKSINDKYGHGTGDKVLKEFVGDLTHILRGSDILYRVGGEEFGILLHNASIQDAVRIAERCRNALESRMRPYLDNKPVTASFGVVEINPGESLKQVTDRADIQLYKAKDAGRNCVMTDSADILRVGKGHYLN